jgi:NAD(P)-dependent dehydrogenase (short-subunit alcohol dehydrogenase family)
LITGASSGNGRATVRRFARPGVESEPWTATHRRGPLAGLAGALTADGGVAGPARPV